MNRSRAAWPIVLCLVAAGSLLYGMVLPGGYLTWLWIAMVLWAVAAVGWVMTVPGQSVAVRMVVPVVSVVTMVPACTGVVGRALFPLHRSGMEQLATTPSGGSVGLYRFASVWTHDRCVTYVTEDSGMSSFAGLVRCEPGVRPSPRLGDTARPATFEPLGDDWYAFIMPRSGSPVWGFNPFAVGGSSEV